MEECLAILGTWAEMMQCIIVCWSLGSEVWLGWRMGEWVWMGVGSE